MIDGILHIVCLEQRVYLYRYFIKSQEFKGVGLAQRLSRRHEALYCASSLFSLKTIL